MSNMSTRDWMDIEDDLRKQLAARDATIARLEGENADYERLSAMHRETRELREQKIAELRAECERLKASEYEHCIRADKAEAEVERLRLYIAADGDALELREQVKALQADLDEARAVVRDMAKALKVVGWGGDDLDINKRAAAVLAKSERGK